jgi:hypothetical protein
MSRVLPVSNSDVIEEEDEFDNSIDRKQSAFLKARADMNGTMNRILEIFTVENVRLTAIWFLDLASLKFSISVSPGFDNSSRLISLCSLMT